MRRLWLWLPPALYMGLIFYLSAQANPLPLLTAHVWDKLLHAIEYAGLGVLLLRAFKGERLPWRTALLLALVLTSLYGASDEWHQSFVPGRDSEIADWYADTTGGGIGALAGFLLAWLPMQIGRAQDVLDDRQRSG
ncbi:MAG TPA: VanZ family protein [Vicinamibacterales bacterium]|nr:VanZ family protein [Vicinamibacterales bacterium]